VAHAAQPVEQRVQNGARGAPVDVRDEADPARVALDGRVVEESVGADLCLPSVVGR
jgi:hypothetical protein